MNAKLCGLETSKIPMPLLNTPFEPGHCLEAVESIEEPEMRKMALAEYHYFSGRPEQASEEVEVFLTSPDLAIRLSAIWVYGFANLATGHLHKVKYALAELNEAMEGLDESTSPYLRAIAVCISTASAVLLHLPFSEQLQQLKKCMHLLPKGLRLFALYVQAHAFYLEGRYGESIGIVEAAMTIQSDQYSISMIYLHLIATMGYMRLKKPEQGREHLLAAWELACPDNLIEPLGEHHGLLGGMLEVVIKKDWPEDFKRIIAVTYRFSFGWRRIHSIHTGKDVADNLTTTEFTIAMLASRDWTNQEIAAHLDISPNTVKRHISTALQKLNISQRKELRQFMLQ